jgi:hypothetical protein
MYIKIFWISGFHGGDCEEYCLLCSKALIVRKEPDISEEYIASIFRVRD